LFSFKAQLIAFIFYLKTFFEKENNKNEVIISF